MLPYIPYYYCMLFLERLNFNIISFIILYQITLYFCGKFLKNTTLIYTEITNFFSTKILSRQKNFVPILCVKRGSKKYKFGLKDKLVNKIFVTSRYPYYHYHLSHTIYSTVLACSLIIMLGILFYCHFKYLPTA